MLHGTRIKLNHERKVWVLRRVWHLQTISPKFKNISMTFIAPPPSLTSWPHSVSDAGICWHSVINIMLVYHKHREISSIIRDVDLALWHHGWCQSKLQWHQTWNFWYQGLVASCSSYCTISNCYAAKLDQCHSYPTMWFVYTAVHMGEPQCLYGSCNTQSILFHTLNYFYWSTW